MLALASGLSWFLLIYVAIGLVHGLFFLLRKVERSDPAAVGSTRGFKVLILPGLIALWPLFVARSQQTEPRIERTAHRDAS